jgi:hypothetical protein
MRAAACLASTSERVNVDKGSCHEIASTRALASIVAQGGTIDGAIRMTASKCERLRRGLGLFQRSDRRRNRLLYCEAHERSLGFLRSWTTPVVSAQQACDVLGGATA